MERLFPFFTTGEPETNREWVKWLVITALVNCAFLAAYVLTACIIVWAWFG